MFDTVLVANRGEIAVRIFDTLEDLGIRSVAVYSDADAGALHSRRADVAVHIGPTPAAASYLSIERVLEAARKTGATAIHPGYGFLSENAAFARACADAGITFIGPPPEAMEAMGDKIRSKQTVEAAGVPVVPGVHQPGMSDEDLTAAAETVGYPLMVKATAGGGGKGMRVVHEPADLQSAIDGARREAKASFGNDDLLMERYVTSPRHIEVQVFADTHGTVVHLGERECSLQRRHQKVIEECPSPLLDEGMRQRMGSAAVEAARAVGYVGAGTVEFIVSGDRPDEFFFLEMNTRLQVEHPVTEEVYGVDLVAWQVRIAAGETIPVPQEELVPNGHAVEARVYAEDPARGFLPTGGTLLRAYTPWSDGLRVDTGIEAGMVVGSAYDPMLAKVIAWGPDRATAIARLRHGLAETVITGVVTNIPFMHRTLGDEDVAAGRLDTNLLERKQDVLAARSVPDLVFAIGGLAKLWEIAPPADKPGDPFDAASGWRVGERAWATWRMQSGEKVVVAHVRGSREAAEVRLDDGPIMPAAIVWDGHGQAQVTLDGVMHHVAMHHDGDVAWISSPEFGTWPVDEQDELSAARHEEDGAGGALTSPMPGTVTVVNVSVGESVTAGQTLLVVEAMKMEHPITAPIDGVVQTVHVQAGQAVAMDAPLAVVAAPES